MQAFPTQRKRNFAAIAVAVLLVLLAMGGLAAAVVWVGGIDEVLEIVGIAMPDDREPLASTPRPRPDASLEATTTRPDLSAEDLEPTATPPAAQEPTPTTTTRPAGTASQPSSGSSGGGTAPATPGSIGVSQSGVSQAQAAMYREQLQSQGQIVKLVENDISAVTIGRASGTSTRTTIPLTVSYRSGGSLSGSMVLTNIGGKWYFSSISAGGDSTPAKPRTVDSGVVSVISSQQAEEGNQTLIKDGLINGGFVTARVDGVAAGSGTATLNITLLGGSMDRKAARLVMISKEDSGRKYWFITRFELK